jgi:hypothetical protein
MFTEISWNSYITIMIVLLAGYYLFMGWRYYRTDILQLFSGRRFTKTDSSGFSAPGPSIKPDQGSHKINMQEAFEKQDLFQIAQSLSDEIRAYLNEAGSNKIQKEEALKSLKIIVAKYPALKGSPFREFIQQVTEKEFETNCSVRLSEEEISELWI